MIILKSKYYFACIEIGIQENLKLLEKCSRQNLVQEISKTFYLP